MTAWILSCMLASKRCCCRCIVMFRNDRLGEFAQEVRATVGMPLPIAKLALRVTDKDGSGAEGGQQTVQRELLLPSKNLALQHALLGVLLERCVERQITGWNGVSRT